MLLRRFIFLIIALSLQYNVNGQGVYNIIKQIDETGSGPEKSVLTQNINNPINLGTGGVNFELPLFEIKQNGYNLPVNLNYSSNGFKVSDISSNVGLGWQLSAGGMITRTIKGLRDEINYNGYTSNAGSIVHQKLSDGEITSYDEDPDGFLDAFQALMYTADGLYDSEPDIYSFTFGNNSGSFLFNHEGNIHFVPEQNFQINVIRSGNSNSGESNHILSFEITDADGIVYVFGHIEDDQYREEALIESFAFYSGLESHYISSADGFYPRKYRTTTTSALNNDNHYSAWVLQKIVLTDESEISFEYVLDEVFTYVGTDEVYYAWYSQNPLENNGDNGPFLIDDPYVVTRFNKFRLASIPRLSGINWDLGKIMFNPADSQREDMNDFQLPNPIGNKKGYAINEIIIEDYLGTTVSTIELDQSYFEYPGGTEYEWYSSYFKRLRLDEVRIQDKSYTFDYYYGELSNLGGLFFPSRNTSQVDFWGYFKKHTGTGTAPRVVKPSLYCYPDDVQNPLYQSIYSIFPRSNYQGIEYYFDDNLGNNLEPNPESAKVGMLKTIHLPTGGSIEYEYELNDFIFDENQMTGGGIRVSKIKKKHAANEDFTTIRYEYEASPGLSSGRLSALPQHAKSNYYSEVNGWDTYFNGKDKFSIRTTRQFSTMTDMMAINESMVRYGKVTEYIEGTGRTEYFFNHPFMAEDSELFVNDQLFIRKADILRTTYYQAPGYPNMPPYLLDLVHRDGAVHLTDPLTGWFSGKLAKEKHFDDQDRKILEKTYHYSIKPNSDPGIFYLQSKYHANMAALWVVLDENQGPAGEIDIFELDIIWGVNRYKTGRYLLSEIETIEYNHNVNNYYSNLTEYDYNDFGLLNSSIQYLSDKSKKHSKLLNSEYINHEYLFVADFYADVVSDGTCENEYNNCLDGVEINLVNCESICEQYYSNYPDLLYICLADCFEDYQLSSESCEFDYQNCLSNHHFRDMLEKNMLSFPVETRTSIKRAGEPLKHTSGIIYNYNTTNPNDFSYLKPIETLIFEADEPLANSDYVTLNDDGELVIPSAFKPEIENIKYGPKANINEVKLRGDQITTYIWGYSHNLLIAKIENASYDLVVSELAALGHSIENLHNITSDTQLRQIFNKLRGRTAMKDAMITSYTHKPLVGMTSQTDPTGWTTFYEYDSFGRLQYVKNHEGHYLNKYDYHYREDEQPGKTDSR